MRNIPRYDFYKRKYGDELLIDVVCLGAIKKYIKERPAHTLTYYDITLITDGEGEFHIDSQTYHVKPQDIIFTLPGQIREWDKEGIRAGFALIFEEEFLLSFFNDRDFLRKLSFSQIGKTSAMLSLDDERYQRVSDLITEIQQEIDHYQINGKHLLRALLYEVLVWLDRLYAASAGTGGKKENKNGYVERFTSLVEISFKQDHAIQCYADQLCITPNYLNELVKETTGSNAKQFIILRILSEAKRLLAYTDQPVGEIAEDLGFATSSYFIRLFRSRTGMTPSGYRKSTKEIIQS